MNNRDLAYYDRKTTWINSTKNLEILVINNFN